jgi:hypothetical protein
MFQGTCDQARNIEAAHLLLSYELRSGSLPDEQVEQDGEQH